MEICKTIIGIPKPQPRTKARAWGGRAMMYNPKTADAWKATIAASLQQYRGLALEGRIWVSMEFRLQRPKSHYGTGKNSQKLNKRAPECHTQKPDVDNLAKAVMDAITNINLWNDDCQVNNLCVTKEWVNENPGMNLMIRQKTTNK